MAVRWTDGKEIDVGFFSLKNGYLLRGGAGGHGISGSPINGTSGTLAGKAGPAFKVFDYTNGVEWINVGTKPSPVWSPVTPVIFSITSANILAMFTTPVNLIAAPPAGYAVVVDNVLLAMTRTSTQYAGGGAISLVYSGGAVVVHTGTTPATVVTGAAGTVLSQMGSATAANGTVVPTATGVDITNATAVFTTGTGTMKAILDYRIMRQA